MLQQRFSKTNLEKKKIDHQPDGDGIEGLYGIVTEAKLNGRGNESFKIGENWYGLRSLNEKLAELTRTTKRKYDFGYISNEVDYEDIAQNEPLVAIVGRPLKSLMHETISSNNGLFTRKSLLVMLNQSSRIIKDLTSLGFQGLKEDDLYLFCQSPRTY